MKIALVLVILSLVCADCLGQNFCAAAESNDGIGSILTNAEKYIGVKLHKNIRIENSSKTARMIQYDGKRFHMQNLKFKVTFSDSWFTRDKAHHFLSSAFLSAAGYYFFREEQKFSNRGAQTSGLCFSVSLGLAKEFRDGLGKNNAFSVKDFVANLLGIAVGLLIMSD